MNIRWLKDFIAVAELGSFSRAADARAITQPAMSRHIKGLEDHIGLRLIDRSTFPASLTPAGKQFVELAKSSLYDLESGIHQIRQQQLQESAYLRFAMQHALASEFFAPWWQSLNLSGSPLQVKVEATNFHDCVEMLDNGHCDLLICFRQPDVDFDLDSDKYVGKKISEDVILPVSALGKGNKPLYPIDVKGGGAKPIPVASSGVEDFMGKVVAAIIQRNAAKGRFNRIYEDSFSEGVRSQALIGAGLAWLPGMLVQRDIDNNSLVVVGDQQWQQPLDIFLYGLPGKMAAASVRVWETVADMQS